ncbi:unnamed protein product, partial [Ilex paraguariensis]
QGEPGKRGFEQRERAREEGIGWDGDLPGRAVWRWVANSGRRVVRERDNEIVT